MMGVAIFYGNGLGRLLMGVVISIVLFEWAWFNRIIGGSWNRNLIRFHRTFRDS